MPKLSAFALPVTWIVSVRLLAPILILPFAVFTLALPPVSEPSAVCSSASVDTWPTPVPNVMVSGGLAPTVMVIVCPCATALCDSRLVGSVVPTERPSSVIRSGDVLVMSIAVSDEVLCSTR